MTKPKQAPRRLGFRDGSDDPELAPYKRTVDSLHRQAQWIFLQTIAKVAPAVLVGLDLVSPDVVCGVTRDEPNEAELLNWATTWNLNVSWCVAHARATWRAWRAWPSLARTYWFDRGDLSGDLVGDDLAPSVPRPLVSAQHFEWLVRFQCLGQGFTEIAASDGLIVQTVHEGIQKAADLIELAPRRVSPGRPSIQPTSSAAIRPIS